MSGIGDCKCVLVVGATSGIGRALALAIHALPSKPIVIVSGRRQERLDELSKMGDRLKTVRFDVNGSRDDLQGFVQDITSKHPDLDAVMFSSGVQHIFDFNKPEKIDLNKLHTNYTAVVRMITFFLPHFFNLDAQGRSSYLIPISSSLAIVPKSSNPNYCATKAALHSLSLSLNHQLRDTNINVMEILPPLVESELHDHQGTTPALSKAWMPLDKFTEEVMEGLKQGDFQIAVGFSGKNWNKFEKGKIEAIH
ncbi:NAD(P)-binding protein [Obba rivulosa]|uniref:NAD(P)-binding protein n=1 Tax=Obba rivulosa TaxID=1052685 RepID=A0A8E2DU93_9APHY|nr:NAD(P)-binding protein [Obba rivulosa]